MFELLLCTLDATKLDTSVTSAPEKENRSIDKEELMMSLNSLARTELMRILWKSALRSPDVYARIQRSVTKSGIGPSSHLAKRTGSQMSVPEELRDYDRIGFLRFRKVASTSLHRFMTKSGFCVGQCEFQACLYRRTLCQDSLLCTKSVNPSYPCWHLGAPVIHNNFLVEKSKWMLRYAGAPSSVRNEIDAGQLHMVTILREPNARVVSEFFYGQTSDPKMDWNSINPGAIKELVVKGDFDAFVAFGDENPALNRMTLQLLRHRMNGVVDWPQEEDKQGKPIITNSTVTAAIEWLCTFRLVLLAEYVPQGLLLFRHVFAGHDPPAETLDQMRATIKRKSVPSEKRRAIESDTELQERLTRATWAEQHLYQEAKTLFFDAFRGMLISKGE